MRHKNHSPSAFDTRRARGFSIVEMVVAVALFSMVVLMSIASMLSLLDANKKARTVKTSMDNLNLVIDEIAQDLRLGSKYYCEPFNSPILIVAGGNSVQDCAYEGYDTDGGPYIGFRDRYGKVVFYYFDPAATGANACIKRKVTDDDWSGGYTDTVVAGTTDAFGSRYFCMTPSDITITHFRFYVYGTASNSGIQPRAVFSVKGTAGSDPRTRTSFSIMTSATQRLPHNVE